MSIESSVGNRSENRRIFTQISGEHSLVSLYKKYYPGMLRYARILTEDFYGAEDIVQEA